MTAEWKEATQEVINIAEQIIQEYYQYLEQARIAFVFRDEAQSQNGRTVIGAAAKVPAKMQPYMEFDFLIWLAEDEYKKLTYEGRSALIDHQLAHCSIGDSGWKIRPHDIEDFSFIIERRGLYSRDLQHADAMIEKYKQNSLFEMGRNLEIIQSHVLEVSRTTKGSVGTITNSAAKSAMDAIASGGE